MGIFVAAPLLMHVEVALQSPCLLACCGNVSGGAGGGGSLSALAVVFLDPDCTVSRPNFSKESETIHVS